MYVCMYVCMYVRMSACIHVCRYTCMHACMYVHIHVFVHTYVYMYVGFTWSRSRMVSYAGPSKLLPDLLFLRFLLTITLLQCYG